MRTPSPALSASGRTSARGRTLSRWCLLFVCGCLGPAAVHAQAPTTPAPTTPATQPPALPPGVELPPEVDPQWLILDENPVEFSKKEESDYRGSRGIASKEVRSDEQRLLIEKGVRWRLAQMTLKANREVLPRLRNDLMADLRTATASRPGERPIYQARDLILKTIVREVEDLRLFENHFVVRLNVAILLAELNSREEDARFGQREIPLYEAAGPLLKVIAAEDQRDPVKIWAARGVARIAADKEVNPDLRHRIVRTVLDELKGSKTRSTWYQLRLAESLGIIGVMDDPTRRPVVVAELAVVLVDKQRHWIVRCESARAIGRLPLDNRIHLDVICTEIVRLAEQMGQAYEQKPKEVFWPQCFFTLYLAYRPMDKGEQSGLLLQAANRAALAPHRKLVDDSYRQVLPLTKAVLGSKDPVRIPDQLKSIRAWLTQNPAKENSVAPGEAPLIGNQPGETAPPSGASGSAAPATPAATVVSGG